MNSTREQNDQINLIVTEDQKERWKEHVEEHGAEFQSLSHLIRRAVEQEVHTNSAGTPNDASSPRNHDEVLQAIGRLDEKLQDFGTRLASIENEVRDDPEIRDIANRLFECLPTKDELLQYERTVATAGTQPPEDVVSRSQSGRIADIAATLEEPRHQVREGLQRLQQDTHQVHTLTRENETRYYKED